MSFKPVINNGLPELHELNEVELSIWRDWTASRPRIVKDLCEKFPPWLFYEMPETKQVVRIIAYAEDGTLRVLVCGDQISFPAIAPIQVFGVKPENLIPWLPEGEAAEK